jgi:hypothetical protein
MTMVETRSNGPSKPLTPVAPITSPVVELPPVARERFAAHLEQLLTSNLVTVTVPIGALTAVEAAIADYVADRRTSTDARLRAYRLMLEDFSTDAPPLADAELSRASIYRGRQV